MGINVFKIKDQPLDFEPSNPNIQEHIVDENNPHKSSGDNISYNETTTVNQAINAKSEVITTHNISVEITDWEADTNGYKAVKSVLGLTLASNVINATLDLSGATGDTWNDIRTEYAKIGYAEVLTDSIAIYSNEAPTEALSLIIKVVEANE